ncbi:MAG: methyl-accepting chemotaxis protein, partial [Pyrinomonadaceae bacterium]|nr:methyl-accepting chemotaxis protein [Phycisphaerales bacterium]
MEVKNGNWLYSLVCLTAVALQPALGQADKADTAGASPAAKAPSVEAATPAPVAARLPQIASTGTFKPATAEIPKRAEFGPQVGKAAAVEAVSAHPEPVSRSTASLLLLGTALSAAITLVAAFVLARKKQKDGSHKMAFTLGSKLVMSTGALATMLLVCAANSSRAGAMMTEADNSAFNTAEKVTLVRQVSTAMLDLRVTNRGFRLKPTDENLAEFSRAAATMNELVRVMTDAVDDPKLSEMLTQIKTSTTAYIDLVAAVVQLTDERTRLTQVLMLDAAKRVDLLIGGVVEALKGAGATASGNEVGSFYELALQAASSAEKYQEARAQFFRFNMFNNVSDATKAREIVTQLQAELALLAEKAAEPTVKNWLAEAQDAVKYWDTGIASSVELKNKYDASIKKNTAAADKLVEQCDAMTVVLKDHQVAAATRSSEVEETARVTSLVIAGGAVLIACGIAYWLTSSLTRASARVLVSLRAVAAGDLTRGPLNETRGDEIGEIARAADEMAKSLKDVIVEVSSGSREVSAAATEIAASSEQMSAAVGEVARQAAQASQSADTSGKIATSGGQVVKSTVERMREIETTVSESAANVTMLGQKGEEIGKVIAVI